MKKNLTLLIVAITLIFSACNNSQKQTVTEAPTIILVDSLMTVADSFIEDTILIKGHVTHTCKHSGRRAFLSGNNENHSIRIEAGGAIEGFDKSLTGSTLIVKGILKEKRLTEEYLQQWEEELAEKAEEDGSAESCSAEKNNLLEMREWMKAHGKNYYSVYHMEGLSYEVAE